jgi:putative flippase GtrA
MKRFLAFAVAGGIAAACNFGSRFAFSAFLPYPAAIVAAYLVGMATAFFLNRAFVFTDGGGSLRRQAGWFVVVNVAAVLQTLAISLLLADVVFPRVGFAFHPEAVAHAIGIVVPIFSSYIGHRRLSFRPD